MTDEHHLPELTNEELLGREFRPERFMTTVNRGPYLPVAARQRWLTHDADEQRFGFTVDTEIVTLNSEVAVVKAIITIHFEDNDRQSRRASGYGSCQAKSFGDYLEKAETKAKGRALAALGFGPIDMLDDAGLITEAPIPNAGAGGRNQGATRSGSGGGSAPKADPKPATGGPKGKDVPEGELKVSDRMLEQMAQKAEALKMAWASVEDVSLSMFEKDPQALNRAEAAKLIGWLDQEQKKAKALPAGGAAAQMAGSRITQKQIDDMKAIAEEKGIAWSWVLERTVELYERPIDELTQVEAVDVSSKLRAAKAASKG